MDRLRPPVKILLFASILALAVVPEPCRAQQKLYLKDGTYLLVRSYQISGGRVRYFSIPDSQWEEMPASLIDFKTTERAITERQEEQQKVLQQAEKTVKDNYQLPKNSGYQVAPGVRLPFQEGLYAYDGVRLITLTQSQGTLVRDKKRMALSLAVPGPFLKGRSFLILPGPAAAVRVLSHDPVFYAKFADGAGARLVLLRLKPRKSDRVVEAASTRTGSPEEGSRGVLPLQITRITSILVRLKPARPLAPGEYALEQSEPGVVNLSLWDFGIDSLQNSGSGTRVSRSVIRALGRSKN